MFALITDAQARREWWAKVAFRYATLVTSGPCKVIACGWLVPVLFFAVVWLTLGPPYLGTDFSAYMKKEGIVADRNDAFEAAVVHGNVRDTDGERRLESIVHSYLDSDEAAL